uniref:Integrin alpha-7 n=1 Tax=Nothoprocta perdicaria TaxID=30464 RepID=A0A8C6YS59_NOTPE
PGPGRARGRAHAGTMAGPLPRWAPWLCLQLLGAAAFNLDVANTLLKDGDKGSLFGFSVALHRQLRPDRRSRLLVGAPQAPALPSQGANRTGGLYACPLSHEVSDCWRRESKENQWLGVSVKSQGPGGKIVTCAHLYETRNRVRQPLETRDVIGRCYVLSQDLHVRDELDGGEWKFCEGRPQGHDRFGFCQQGLAAGFTADSHYILFGAPGTYNWKGERRVQGVGGLRRGGSGCMSLLAGVPGWLLGYRRQAGRPLLPSLLSFVTGAPRANHTGAVVILRRDSAQRLVPEAVLPGEQLTSAFGYALAVLDLNGDGWMDLAVGAPHFFERHEEIGGAAYIYINPGGRWAAATPLRLNGTYGSMFGIALSAAGDLDQDGFSGEGGAGDSAGGLDTPGGSRGCRETLECWGVLRVPVDGGTPRVQSRGMVQGTGLGGSWGAGGRSRRG